MQNNQEGQEKPHCPYNCPYKPSKEERKEVEDVVSVSDIDELDPSDIEDMTAILRTSDYEGDVHVQKVWETDYGPKVGISSEPEYADVFNELDWERAHHKWSSERTEGTDMWEVDLDALMYVCFYFLQSDIDVTLDDLVREKYLRHEEGLPLELD